jgi:hypothetical protein
MSVYDWVKEFPGDITVCDPRGIILEMNDKAARSLEVEGGRKLKGSNLLDCHPEPARSKVEGMLAACKTNIYTIEKKGIKKLIYQTPWYQNGIYAGFLELSLEIPFDMPHFIRT